MIATQRDLREMDDMVKGSSHIGQTVRMLCDPAQNHLAAAWFITRCCKTIDEDPERAGKIAPIADWPFVLELIDFLEGCRTDRFNGLVDKSRRMLGTWTACAWFLWRSQWIKGFPAFLTTGKGGDYVDDGGENSTPKSVFGRLRFMWDRIPWDEAKKPTDFAFKRVTCEETDAYISGEAPNEQGGRSGGYVAALVDEAAFAPHSEELNRALDPACRRGRVYITTHNGRRTVAARIVLRKPEGWRVHVLDWPQHPDLNQGLASTPENEVERFGPVVSPAFRRITSSLRDEDIAQEYNHSIERSMRGLVWKTFHVRRHVAELPIPYDPQLPLFVGVDYGSTGFGAAAGGQVGKHDKILRVIFDYEIEGAGGARAHALNIAEKIRGVGFEGDFGDVVMVGGPDTDQTTGSGQSIAGYFRAAGFHRIRQCAVRGPGSESRRIAVVDSAFRWNRVVISPTCDILTARLLEYRWPTERATGDVRPSKSVSPVHDASSHIADGFGYLACEALPQEDAFDARDNFELPVVTAVPDRFEQETEDDGAVPRGRGLLTGWRARVDAFA